MFSVSIVNNTTVEPTETFTVVLSSPVGAPITKGTGVVTIVDNDGTLIAAGAPTRARPSRRSSSTPRSSRRWRSGPRPARMPTSLA